MSTIDFPKFGSGSSSGKPRKLDDIDFYSSDLELLQIINQAPIIDKLRSQMPELKNIREIHDSIFHFAELNRYTYQFNVTLEDGDIAQSIKVYMDLGDGEFLDEKVEVTIFWRSKETEEVQESVSLEVKEVIHEEPKRKKRKKSTKKQKKTVRKKTEKIHTDVKEGIGKIVHLPSREESVVAHWYKKMLNDIEEAKQKNKE